MQGHTCHGMSVSLGYTGLNMSCKGHCLLHRPTDEPWDHWLCRSVCDTHRAHAPPPPEQCKKPVVHHSVRVIEATRSQFARRGAPEVFTSDNGYQFVCASSNSLCRDGTSTMWLATRNTHKVTGRQKGVIWTVNLSDDSSDAPLGLLNIRNTVRLG